MKGKKESRAKEKTRIEAPPKAMKQEVQKKDELSAKCQQLRESAAFEPTSAFRRKAGVALSSEDKRLVGIDNGQWLSFQ